MNTALFATLLSSLHPQPATDNQPQYQLTEIYERSARMVAGAKEPRIVETRNLFTNGGAGDRYSRKQEVCDGAGNSKYASYTWSEKKATASGFDVTYYETTDLAHATPWGVGKQDAQGRELEFHSLHLGRYEHRYTWDSQNPDRLLKTELVMSSDKDIVHRNVGEYGYVGNYLMNVRAANTFIYKGKAEPAEHRLFQFGYDRGKLVSVSEVDEKGEAEYGVRFEYDDLGREAKSVRLIRREPKKLEIDATITYEYRPDSVVLTKLSLPFAENEKFLASDGKTQVGSETRSVYERRDGLTANSPDILQTPVEARMDLVDPVLGIKRMDPNEVQLLSYDLN